MIQRIQTIYLFLVVLLISFFFFAPFASFVLEADLTVYELSVKGLVRADGSHEVVFRAIPLLILVLIVFLVAMVTIFLYKRRVLQIRLCVLNILLLIGLEGMLYYLTHAASNQLGANTSYSLIMVFPVIAAILTYLALRGIAKDEVLVRSMDRLR